jgi:hypothetical protein
MRLLACMALVLAFVSVPAFGQDPARRPSADVAPIVSATIERLRAMHQEDAGFWLALEGLFQPGVTDEARNAALAEALGDTAKIAPVLSHRKDACDAARAFCHDWDELYMEGTGEKERYEAIKTKLTEQGAAVVPYLLEVLSVDPSIAFGQTDETGGVTARMQVRAIFGVSFVSPREAVPFLVLHTHGPSLTSTSNASAVLGKLVRQEFGATYLNAGDLAKIDGWWVAHRAEYDAGNDLLVPSLIDQLRTDQRLVLLGQTMQTEPQMRKGVLKSLRRVTGTEFNFDPDADPATRETQIRTIEREWQNRGKTR